jgi:hypothetical protein
MPALTAAPVIATSAARFWVVTVDLAGSELNAGILLEDADRDRLYLRLRRDWDEIAPEEAEVLEALEDGLRSNAQEMGAARFLAYLEDTLSNTLRISLPQTTLAGTTAADFERALGRLYREHVNTNVLPFVTHLPRYSLAVAAGDLLENREVTPEGWEEAPCDLHLTEGMFVAKIVGKSMEPRIPDGSLCVFKLGVTGSRQGKLVLVEALARGGNDRYTVKRYRSEKKTDESGGWSHERITLEPLNPQFEAWDLDPNEDGYRMIAEFVVVLN